MYLSLGKIGFFILIVTFYQFHSTASLRVQKRCTYGNYFTDGCVSCWCDNLTGQSVCENMIACPRKKVKCPMGRVYQDECSNDCTCYESTGALFCKEKGPCNSVKRRNIWLPPPPPQLQIPAPVHVPEDDQIKMEMSHKDFRNNFEIPNSVQFPKDDLVIEPALIIRRKKDQHHGDKKKHPTTLLYLYEKQLKSMKDFKHYYKQYLDSEKGEHLIAAGSLSKPKVMSKLEIEIPMRSTSPRTLQDFNWVLNNMQTQRTSPKPTTFATTRMTTTTPSPKTESHKVAIFETVPSTTPKRPNSTNYYSASTPRPQFINYYKPTSTPKSHYYTAPEVPTTFRPPQQYHSWDNNMSPSENSQVRTELNKPIFVNHLAATRRYPEIYQSPRYRQPEPLPPPPMYHQPSPRPLRPKQYKLFIKSTEKKPLFYSDRNRVPLFVDKIAREFFKKPEIYVPNIKMVGGQQHLELNRVVYNHREMIPKELVLEPGGLPLKVKFTPEAEMEMNREWMQAMKNSEKAKQPLGYHHSADKNYQSQSNQNNRQYHSYQPQQYPKPVQKVKDHRDYQLRPVYPPEEILHDTHYSDYNHRKPNRYQNDFIQDIVPQNMEPVAPLPSPPYADNNDYMDQFTLFQTHPNSQTTETTFPTFETSSKYPISYHYQTHHSPSTATEQEYVSVSPRPELPSFQIPTEDMDDFSPNYEFPDMFPQATNTHPDLGTFLIDSVTKSEGIEQHHQEGQESIRFKNVRLSHKKGKASNQVRVTPKPKIIPSTTTPHPTSTEFNPEKMLRELLAMDPDIGPDAILFKENGETIPPFSSTTPVPPPTPYIPSINIKGDSGLVSHPSDEEPPTTSSTPKTELSSFEQFYQDLFRPQREEKKRADALLATDGVAKIFHYDKILKSFKSGDSSQENGKEGEEDVINDEQNGDESISIRYLDKRDKSSRKSHKRKGKKGKSEIKDKQRVSSSHEKNETIKDTTIKFSTMIKNKNAPSSTSRPLLAPPEEPSKTNIKGDDPASSFKRELDWKSKLMSDICSVDPNSALCFTYKSLCMLMSS